MMINNTAQKDSVPRCLFQTVGEAKECFISRLPVCAVAVLVRSVCGCIEPRGWPIPPTGAPDERMTEDGFREGLIPCILSRAICFTAECPVIGPAFAAMAGRTSTFHKHKGPLYFLSNLLNPKEVGFDFVERIISGG